jgi:hypothetical protein
MIKEGRCIYNVRISTVCVEVLLSEASSGWHRQRVKPVVCIAADDNYFSNNDCVIDVSFITNQRTAVSLHMKSASPVTDVVLR